jgi:hypothetical protein
VDRSGEEALEITKRCAKSLRCLGLTGTLRPGVREVSQVFLESQMEATTLYRIQTAAMGKSWIFVCEGCCIKAKASPGYRYGGTWQGYRH